MTTPPRRRRRWLRWTLVVLLALLLLVRFGGLALLPFVLEKVLASQGLAARWESLHLSVMNASVAFTEIEVASVLKDGGSPPLVRCAFLEADVDLAALARFQIRIRRLTVDGLVTGIARGADGQVSLEGWPQAESTAPAPPPPGSESREDSEGPDAPFEFEPLIPIGQIWVHGLQLRVKDAAVTPELSTVVTLDAHVDHFGSRERAGRVEARLAAEGVVDEIRLDGDALAQRDGVSGRLALAVRGLSGDVARRYSGDSGFAPCAKRLDLDAAVDLELTVADAKRRILHGHATIARLELDGDAEEQLWVQAHVDVARLGRRELEIPAATIELRGRAQRLASGAWRLAGIERAALRAAPSPEPPSPEPPSPARPFILRIGHVQPRLSLALRDELADPPVDSALSLHDASVKGLVIGAPSESPLEAELAVDAASDAGKGSLRLTANGRPLARPRDAVIEAHATGLKSLLAAFGVGSDFEEGELDLRVVGSTDTESAPMTGDFAVEKLRIADGDRELLSIEALRLSNVELGEKEFTGGKLELLHPVIAVTRDAEGRLLVAGVALPGAVAAKRSTDEVAPPPDVPDVPDVPDMKVETKVEAAREPFAFRLAELAVRDARVLWSDRSVEPAADATLELDATIAAIDSGMKKEAPVEIVAHVDGALEKLRVAGTITPDPDALRAELDLDAQGVKPGPLAAALNKKSDLAVNDGTLRLHASVAVDRVAQGGRSLKFEVKDVAVSAGAGDAPHLTIGRIAVVAPQIDAQAGDVVVDELAIEKAEVAARPPFTLELKNRGPLALWSRAPEKLAPLALDLTIAAPTVAREIKLGIEATPFAAQPRLSLALDAKGLEGAGLAELLPAAKIDAAGIRDGSLSTLVDVEFDLRRRGPLEFDLRDGIDGSIALRDLLLRGTPDGEPLAAIGRVDIDSATLRPATGDVLIKSAEVHAPRTFLRRSDRGLEVAGLLIPPVIEPAVQPAGEAAAEPPPAPAPTPAAAEPPASPSTTPGRRVPEFRVDDLSVTDFDFDYINEFASPRLVLPFRDLELDVRGFTTRAFREPRQVQFRASVHGGEVDLAPLDQGSLIGGVVDSAANTLRGGSAAATEKRPAWEAIDLAGNVTLCRPLAGWARFEAHALELQSLRGSGGESGVEIHDGVVDSTIDVRFRGAEGAYFDVTSTFSRLSVEEPADGPISRWLKLRLPLDTTLFLLRDDDGQQRVSMRFKVEESGIGRGDAARAATKALLKVIGDAVEGAPMRIVKGTIDTVQLSKLPGWEKLPGLDSIPGLSHIPGLNRLLGIKEAPDPVCEPVRIELAPGCTRLPEFAAETLAEIIDEMRDKEEIELMVSHELGEEDGARLEKLARPQPQDVVELGGRLRHERDELAARHARIADEARVAFSLGRSEDAAAAIESLRATDRELAVAERALDRLFENFGERTSRQEERLVRHAAQSLADQRVASLRALLEKAGIPDLDRRVGVRPARATVVPGSPTSHLVIEARRVRS